MSLKITTLIENSAGEHLALKSEHGISFHIQKDGMNLLFDTGQSGAFLQNAQQLRIDMTETKYVILSHGHYDHSGGLRQLMDITNNFKIFMGEGFFQEKYAYRNNSYEYLGSNFDEEYLRKNEMDYQFLSKTLTEIVPGIFIVTNFSRTHSKEVVNPRFKIRRDGKFEQDLFNDELLLVIDSPKGLVVLLGCSHPGVRNMLDTVKTQFKKPIYAVLGGTHLVEAHDEALDISIDYLHNDEIKILGVSHCTGDDAMLRMSRSHKNYLHNRTGSSLFIE